MQFIWDITSKMLSFPSIYIFIASLAFVSLELLVNKLWKGGF